MQNGKNRIIGAFAVAFWVLVTCILLSFFVGEIFLPGVDSGLRYHCQLLPVEWSRVLQDGTKETVEVPGAYNAGKGERVVIEAVMPQNLDDMPWLCFRSSQQDMEIYIDGVLRQEYTTKHTRLFGKNSMSAFVFVEVSQQDAGKEIQVVTTSNSTYSGVLNEVYCGDTFGIWMHFIKLYGVELATAVLIMILGIVCIIFCMVLRVRYQKEFGQEYLGWAMFLAALWMFSESRLRQLVVQNTSLSGNIAFVVVMVLPLPFLLYANYIQNSRYWKIYGAAMLFTLINFCCCVFLQFTNRKDFLESLLQIYVALAITIILVGITIVIDIKRAYIKEYYFVALGLSGMMLAGIIEMLLIYFKTLGFTGLPLSIGLIFLMIMASVKTGQDIARVEKEKQHAVTISEAKMGFLANMSHEIRTPINTVIGMNEMVIRESNESNVQKYATEIHKAGNLLLTMINEMLDFSKIDAGELKLEESPYYLASLLNDIIHDINKKAKEKNLEVVLNIDETLPAELCGDEMRIKQVLNHLISNAVKFTEKGRITFSAKGIHTAQGQFELILSIADTGAGIRQEDLGKLFDSFVRGEETKNRAIEGTGLGLNIAKQLVTQMQGEISVQSVHGKGSIFTVKLPQKVLKAEKIGNLRAAYEREVDGMRFYKELFRAPEARVLAVDDNQMNLVVVKSLLKKTQIQLDLASGGAQALELAKQKKYDLILLDHMMPEPDGVQVLHQLREEQGHPNEATPVVVLTANAVSGIKDWYLNEGFNDYLSKPIVADKLERMIKTYLPKDLIIEVPNIGESDTRGGSERSFGSKSDGNIVALPQKSPEQTAKLIDSMVGLGYCMDDEELYYDILQTYHKQGAEYREKMNALYELGEWKEFAVIAHAIKSTSLNIGAVEMSEIAKFMEQSAKEENTQLLQSKWEEFCSLYEQVLVRAAEMLKPDEIDLADLQAVKEEQSQSIVSKEEYMEACQMLLSYIRAYEMQEALLQIEKLQGMQIPEANQDAGEVLSRIQEAVDGFDYDEAENMLVEWLEKNEG